MFPMSPQSTLTHTRWKHTLDLGDVCHRLSLCLNHACGTMSGEKLNLNQIAKPCVGEAGTTHKHYLYFEFYQSL